MVVVVVVGVFAWAMPPGPQEAPVGVLGPAGSTTAPAPAVSPSVVPRATRSIPRTSPSPLRSGSVAAKPARSRVPAPPRAVATGSWWVEQMRDCIARRESGRSLTAVDPTGSYFGRYQFDRRSWRIASGLSGTADQYGAAEQDRAFYVWFDNGKGRHRWTTYPYCRALYGGPA